MPANIRAVAGDRNPKAVRVPPRQWQLCQGSLLDQDSDTRVAE